MTTTELTHASLSASLLRPPGIPAAACPGRLARVDGAGGPARSDGPVVLDAALADEGDFGDVVGIYLWRCECGRTIVEARTLCGPWRRFQRNEHGSTLRAAGAVPA
jgi:hypothetical protein